MLVNQTELIAKLNNELNSLATEIVDEVQHATARSLHQAMYKAFQEGCDDILDLSIKKSVLNLNRPSFKKLLEASKKMWSGIKKSAKRSGPNVYINKPEIQKIYNEIPDSLKLSLSKLKDLDGEDFLQFAHSIIIKELGIENISPSRVSIADQKGFSQGGGFDFFSAKTSFASDMLKRPKAEVFSKVRHELEHFNQAVDIFRTEGNTFKSVADRLADCEVNKLKNNSFTITEKLSNLRLIASYERASTQGQGDKFLLELKKHYAKDMETKFTNAYSLIIKDMPKIKAGSDEAKKNNEYLHALVNYEGIGLAGTKKGYAANILEVEANKVEKEWKDIYSVFEKTIK